MPQARGILPKGFPMQNVTLGAVVRNHARRQLLCPIRSWRQLGLYALTLALGLPLIAVVARVLDPGAPLAYILVPVLAGGLLPAFALLPGRFEVKTRFQAHHLLSTLDESLQHLGYVKTVENAARLHYQPRRRRWFGGPAADIDVTLHPYAADIAGPLRALRVLQRTLAC
jgi:hypothetical protein